MNDYERIAAIIRYLDEQHASQPSLKALAAMAGLSESHFHRLFHRWAGITPKDFLQCITAERAKRSLRQSASVLDAALDAGLSGPGRLHDLLVTIEAATPGEMKKRGHGMEIVWGSGETPFGLCSLGWNARGICHLSFQELAGEEPPADLLQTWPLASLTRDHPEAERRLGEIFAPGEGRRELRAFVGATPFQLQVWRALVRIPEGSLVTYGMIASALGKAGASRAVGAACGANTVGYLIPCHRVIRETGVVHGYRWGSDRKRAMLAWEAARH